MIAPEFRIPKDTQIFRTLQAYILNTYGKSGYLLIKLGPEALTYVSPDFQQMELARLEMIRAPELKNNCDKLVEL